jgi:hypothetical protein
VNYDLPWNPQRIEQRIGRCHRYGQKHDVVVLNFLNRKNEADKRVYQLLSEKFRLFEGVFGASDELDLAERKVRLVEELGVNDVAVAIIAGEDRSAISVDLQRPELKGFGGNVLLAALANRDCVEQPIGAAGVGNVFCTVREQHTAIDAVTIPLLAAGKVA